MAILIADIFRFLSLAIKLDRLDDLGQIVRDGDGAVGEGGALHAAAAEHFVELVLVGRVIGDRGGRIFELMAGQNADYALVGADHPFAAKNLGAGHAGGAGRFAAQPAGADLRLGVQDLLVGRLADYAVADLERPQAFVQVHRTVDFNGAGDSRGPAFLLVELAVIARDPRRFGRPPIPAQAPLLVKLVERIGAGGVDHGQPRNAIDQAKLLQLGEGFAEGAGAAEVPARHDDPVGNLPAQGFKHAEHDRLLAFEPERIDAVD